MKSDRESSDRRDQSGRRLNIDRRRDFVAVATDQRFNLDRRIPYIRRASIERREIEPPAS